MSQFTFNAPVQYGWVCPLCGKAQSPFTPTCFCDGAGAKEIKTVPDTGTGTSHYGVYRCVTCGRFQCICLSAGIRNDTEGDV